MKRHLIASLMSALSLVLSLMSYAQSPVDLEGQPSTLREGANASYWIWHDSDGFHLRTTTGHDRRVFSGRIEFSGGSGWAKASQLSPNDEVKLTNEGIAFHMPNQRSLKGLDFRFDAPGQATISLQLDDDKGQKLVEHIFLGRNNVHPNSNPFTITAVMGQFPTPSQTQPATQSYPSNPAPGTPGQALASVDFGTDPPGADILIDGNFSGNTPSTLSVSAGRHLISLRLSGYRTWTQMMEIQQGSQVTVRRTLENM